MKKYTTKIPLQQDNIVDIIRAFEDGEYNYWELLKEHPTTTHNGRGAAIWNEIFTELERSFTKEGFQVDKFDRGFWQVLFIYDENTKYLYTFMRYKNFVNLQNKSNENKLYHYCNLLGKINGNLVGTYHIENEQMSFGLNNFEDESTDQELSEILSTMLNKINGDIERYAIVLVNQNKGKVESIECKIPVTGLETIYTESWNDYIGAEYENDSFDIEPTVAEETEIILFNNEKIGINTVERKFKKKKQEQK